MLRFLAWIHFKMCKMHFSHQKMNYQKSCQVTSCLNFTFMDIIFKKYLNDFILIIFNLAFEFWDSYALKLLKAHNIQGTKFPLGDNYPFYVLVEISGSNKNHDDEKLHSFLEKVLSNEIVKDGVVAQDDTQIATLWSLREGIPEACSKAGAVYKYDISIPVPKLYQMIEDVRNRLQSAGVLGEDKLVSNVVGYGHIGDGKLL
jgi:(R)-2-hydroxyglutarate---pyruvate transhydrogenase